MKIKITKNKKGFTLVETMFAVMILSLAIVGMMTVVANSLFASRYARDEITVSYLLQEVVDYVRNDRDTSVFLQNDKVIDEAWTDFTAKYANCSDSNIGCYFDVLSGELPVACSSSGGCPNLCYDENAESTPFYISEDIFGNCSGSTSLTSFQRKTVVVVAGSNPDELNVTVTVFWKNGGMDKQRSLSTTLTKWQ